MNTQLLAKKIRINITNMAFNAQACHLGCGMSMADILAVLYGEIMHIDPHNVKDPERDRFILSKGHGGAALYAVLAECGFFSTELLSDHYKDGSKFSGHVSHKGIPGVELSTGSLGHGLSVAAGMALFAKLNHNNFRSFCLLSDGECNEGSVWEAAIFSAQQKLDNLVAIVDYNKIQGLGFVEEVFSLEPFVKKWEDFGWSVKEIDGHSHDEISNALQTIPFLKYKPSMVIAHTIKGKGIPFMENTIDSHYIVIDEEQYINALKQVEEGK